MGLIGAIETSVLVGYASVQDYGTHLRTGDEFRTARMHDVWVEPGHRGRGHGRALVEAVWVWARGRVRFVEWQAHQDRSAPFYKHLGYHGTACVQPDYPTFVVDLAAPSHVLK